MPFNPLAERLKEPTLRFGLKILRLVDIVSTARKKLRFATQILFKNLAALG